ncbi:hypothetical protein [Fluviicola sp.]|jgi:hypothetical protein|uniref:hypothetical protein n=1 Tax=Fluviicola sp. TaxID=1917219 RepID=UPI002635C533|nr:hypothetical protein [Fluviicola sp.]
MRTITIHFRALLLFAFLLSSSALFSQSGFTYFYSKNIKLHVSSRPIAETCTQVRLLVHYSGSSSGTVTSSAHYFSLGQTKTITVQVPGGTTVTGYSWKFIMANGTVVFNSSSGFGEFNESPVGGGDWCSDSLSDLLFINHQSALTIFYLGSFLDGG